jgi:hypothetical protein
VTADSGAPFLNGRPALSRLLDGPDPQADITGAWDRRPLLRTGAHDPSRFDDLFSADAVDTLVSERGLRAPFLRVARNGVTLPDRDFTASGGVGATIGDQVSDDKLLELFAAGSTIVLQGLHRTWSPLIAFSQQLAADLGHPVQVNAYVTPPQNQGFSDHYDTHDVFVLQIAGEKHWRVREPVWPRPLRDQPWTDHRAHIQTAAQAPPALETTLSAGDCLYLPRGYLHSAVAMGTSIHLTVGVHTWTVRHLIEAIIDEALRDVAAHEQLRASLPIGLDIADADHLTHLVAAAREAVIAASRDISDDRFLLALRGSADSAQRAAPLRPLTQWAAAGQLHADSVVRLRDGLAARLPDAEAGEPAALVCRVGQLGLQEAQLPAVRRLLAAGRSPVADLGVELAHTLLIAGVVHVV